MKVFIVFMIISIAFVVSDEEFGQRISKTTTKSNSTDKESIKTKKKDLDTHESIRTYEYAMAPFEVLSHKPKVIAEEHTLHELPVSHALTSSLNSALPTNVNVNEPLYLTEESGNYALTSNRPAFYGAQRAPKHYGSELPLYKDDPKDQLKGYVPLAFKPALNMEALSQYKSDPNDEITVHAQPISIAKGIPYGSATDHHHSGVSGLNGYSPNLEQHLGPHLQSYGISEDQLYQLKKHLPQLQELQPHHSSRSAYPKHSYVDYIAGIPGKPWKDYPIYSSVPYTNFKCQPHSPGYFADVEAGCQVWHYCQLDGRHDRFLCSNGTLFNQKTRVCDWWYNVDCHSSVLKYGINADLYRVPTHKKYLETPYNPINKYEIPLKHISAPHSYHSIDSDLHHSGHGLVFAESQTVPQKKMIKRVRKIKSNHKSNSTESVLKNSKTTKQSKLD